METRKPSIRWRVASVVVGLASLALALALVFARGKTYPPGLECGGGHCYVIGHPYVALGVMVLLGGLTIAGFLYWMSDRSRWPKHSA